MLFLCLSILNLLLAPVVYRWASQNPRLWTPIERLTSFAIAFIVIGFLLPESYVILDWKALLAGAFGLALPSLLERLWHHKASSIHLASLALSISGLALHALMDGAALTMDGHHHHHHHHHHDHGIEHTFLHLHGLPLAVVCHQLPVGLFIWGLFSRWSAKKRMGILGLNALGTILGYALGEEYIGPIHDSEFLAYAQAIFSGTLLHVIFDPHDPKGCHHHGHHNHCHH